MNKSVIKNFSIEARKLLLKMAVTEAGLYDITKDRCGVPVQKGTDFEVYRTIAGTENRIFGDIIKKRANLVKAISEHGFESVMEEAAYTWFNRLIAVRFMEVNDYLPSRVRVLSSETGSSTPDVVTKSLDVDLNMNANEVAAVQKAKEDNKYDEAFRLLFIKQCNELNEILPGLFETTDDYMELLLKLSYTNDGVVRMLVDSVPEEDFDVSKEGQVEIIGWMYQYYNTELKDETFALLKKNVKITKERIPAATQLFTPDWIVRYMVENSLGRLWIEHLRANDDSVDEKATVEEFGWKYYLPEAAQEESVNTKLVEVRKSYKEMSPLDIKCIDPCMGSGHILVYMFDVLMDIYKSAGYSERDAAFFILENNISGLDIDQRAYQLSYFALMMKGRGCNRRFFAGREIEQEGRIWRQYPSPDVRAIEESNELPSDIINQIEMNFPDVFNDSELSCIDYVVRTFNDAKEYGSILNVDDEPDNDERQYAAVALNLFSLMDGSHPFCMKNDLNILQRLLLTEAFPLIDELMMQACVMSRKYDVVVTNPPYMGSSGMQVKISDYIREKYCDSKNDLCTVFMESNLKLLKEYGYQAIINQHAWMFLNSYEKLRRKIILENNLINMAHLGTNAFDGSGLGTVVQTCSFVMRKKCNSNYTSMYVRLVNFPNSTLKSYEIVNSNNAYYVESEKFDLIPGATFAYWISENLRDMFKSDSISKIAEARIGLVPGNIEKYMRRWQEVDYSKIGFMCTREVASKSNLKWFPYNKGGLYRKWYGNQEYVIDWENDGKEMQNLKHPSGNRIWAHNFNLDHIFKKHIGWTDIAADNISFREYGQGFIFDSASNAAFVSEENYYIVLGYLNTKIVKELAITLNPTLHFKPGDFLSLPFKNEMNSEITELVKQNILFAKKDWNQFETSWEFQKDRIVNKSEKNNIEIIVKELLENDICDRKLMKCNEEKINEIFIHIFHLDDDFKKEVSIESVNFYNSKPKDIIKYFISYVVGCMFGRYSLSEKGIVYAGGNWDIGKYSIFVPDTDNIIPISDEEYFEDDITCKFIEFIKIVFGELLLEDNLKYIANILDGKGNNDKEIIRNYFIKDFFKDHCKIYQKRPIYWMFDSGKQNGFKVLIYMHRYDRDTVGRIRADYLHKTQNAIEGALKNVEYIISSSSSAVDKAKATKDRDRYIKQLSETRIYDQALAHVALQRIEIDLDDGVKHNYELFQGIEVAGEGTKKQTVDLLAKI